MKKILFLLLTLSAIAFSLDLFHMIAHLIKEPTLWEIEGVHFKLFLKIAAWSLPIGILIYRKKWAAWIMILLFLGVPADVLWARPQSSCEHARQLMDQAGTARDAHEDFMGRIKLDPPYGSFPTDMDKVTWWGEFEPFEFWDSPEFTAVWINPQGQDAAVQKFRGTKCRLAKTTLPAFTLPRGQLTPGMWKVLITCDDYLIDKQDFAVLPDQRQGAKSGETQPASDDSMMIWTGDILD